MQYFSQSCCVWEIHSHVNVHEFYEKEIEVRVSEQCGLVAILFHHAKSFVMFCTSWQHEKWMIGFLKKWSDFLLWISAFKSLVLKFHNSYLLAHRANADFFFIPGNINGNALGTWFFSPAADGCPSKEFPLSFCGSKKDVFTWLQNWVTRFEGLKV